MRTSPLILGDGLLERHPDLALSDVDRVVMIEAGRLVRARPYHRKKLVLMESAMRHYALDLSRQRIEVDYLQADELESGLKNHLSRFSLERLVAMEPDSHWLRARLPAWS